MRSLVLLFVWCATAKMAVSLAQHNDVPLNRDIYLDLDRNHACRTSPVHTGLRPQIESRVDLTNVLGHRPDSTRHYYILTKVLFKTHLIDVNKKGFRVVADGVWNFELGQDFRDPSEFADTTRFYVNARGYRIAADIGARVSFSTTFYETQAIYPQYLYQYVNIGGVVPGQGRIKTTDQRGFDFSWAGGNVSWSPRRWVNVQFGHGKHFVGNGYRSVLLSDNAFNYPYLKHSWLLFKDRVQYSSIMSKLQMVGEANRLPTGESSESIFYWKRATFNHLSVNVGPAQIGLFEATHWRTVQQGGSSAFNGMQLNPVIGINTLAYGFSSEGVNNMLGLDVKVKLTDKLFAYGQFATDDPGRERFAWQAGLRMFDIFKQDLHLLLEYNSASAFTYGSATRNLGMVHYNQPMAHPLGANFTEAVGILDYRKKRWFFTGKVNVAQIILQDTLGTDFGNNPLVQQLGVLGAADVPEVHRQLVHLDLSAGWIMNQNNNARIVVGWTGRDLGLAADHLNSSYLYVALRTGLFNRYYDI
ncbi:MAG: hypothetical protein IPJ76_10470 [Flavobacteriales bacterium]|nr:MAG: hypothetical protein IPJ76_10470 [Flavobacteriales bacterium]